jgi:hypothetical protein
LKNNLIIIKKKGCDNMPQGIPLITVSMLSEKLRNTLENSATVNTYQEYEFVATEVGTTASIIGGNITAFSITNDYLSVYRNGKKIPPSKYTIDGTTITFADPYIIDDVIEFVRVSNGVIDLRDIGSTFGIYELKYKLTEDTTSVNIIPEQLDSFIEETDTLLVVTNTVMLEINEHFRISDDLTSIIALDSDGNDTSWKAGTELYIYYFRT